MITAYKHVRILLSLLKQYGVRHFVISPGSRNIPIVKSVEDDPDFTCYSVVDERSAAYIAVGMTLELRAPVALSCTSAQATRNYFPGLTEAYYRKAPVVAITVDYDENLTGQMTMQSIVQTCNPPDFANISVDIPIIKDSNDEHLVISRLNKALDALTRSGGGPVHINLRINEFWSRGPDELEKARKITRYTPFSDQWPEIGDRKVLLCIGQHHPFSEKEQIAIESFGRRYNTAIYVNHISNYHGAKAVHGNARLFAWSWDDLKPDLVVTIGGQTGDYPMDGCLRRARIEHWRVCEDGQYGDSYNALTSVFECPEWYFFERMAEGKSHVASDEYYRRWVEEIEGVKMPETYPLSHMLVAKTLAPLIPQGSILHFGILNALRCWEMFPLDPTIRCYSNVAGFGIDGGLSTFIGHSLVSDCLCFMIIGDLSFFYDMNVIGNRHIRNNVRIVLVNNGGGGEFRLKSNAADQFGDSSNRFIAATGHFGASAEGWCVNNGFLYRQVREPSQLEDAWRLLIGPSEKPIVVEVFTTMRDEAEAIQSVRILNDRTTQKEKIVKTIKQHIPTPVKQGLKRILGR